MSPDTCDQNFQRNKTLKKLFIKIAYLANIYFVVNLCSVRTEK